MSLMDTLRPAPTIPKSARIYQTMLRCARRAREAHILAAGIRKTELQARILGAISDWGPITNGELAILLDVRERRVRTATCDLAKAGLIGMHGAQGWRLRT